MSLLPYDPRLRTLARELRNPSTVAEILLWNRLKRGQRRGFDFHRQKPILHWIADFYCAELKLAVEIDGDSHRFKPDADRAKESGLRSLGLALLRFGDAEVKNNPEAVVAAIDRWIVENCAARPPEEHTPAFGHPSPEGTSANESRMENSPLRRGGAERRGGFARNPSTPNTSNPRAQPP